MGMMAQSPNDNARVGYTFRKGARSSTVSWRTIKESCLNL